MTRTPVGIPPPIAPLRATLAGVLGQDPGPERMQIEVIDNGGDGGCARAITQSPGGGGAGPSG